MSDQEIQDRLKRYKKTEEWKSKVLSRKPKLEKLAKIGPILSDITFCIIIATVFITEIPPVENFVRNNLSLFAFFLGGMFLVAIVGFVLGWINTNNQTYYSLLRAEENRKKMKKQLEGDVNG